MSQRELDRLDVILRLERKELKRIEASQLLGVSPRQVTNLLNRYRAQGASGLVSGHRGLRNRAYSAEFKAQVIGLASERYSGFPPCHLRDMLRTREGIHVSKETVRQWLIEAGLWTTKPRRAPGPCHRLRARRALYGELIQIDGSPHEWFPGQPKCSLLVFVDDATSRIQLMRFYRHECTQGYLSMMKEYAERYGLPQTIYSDRHSIFRVNKGDSEGVSLTQFSRALDNLGVEHVMANSPQAKGRVERKNRVLQERLIREMQLDNIQSMEEANGAYLDRAAERLNALHAVMPYQAGDAHVAVDVSAVNYEFMTQVIRKVSKNLTVSYQGKTLQIESPERARRLSQRQVIVCENGSGEIIILHKGKPLPFTIPSQAVHYQAPVSRKELSSELPRPKRSGRTRPSSNHPWRNSELASSTR